MRPPILERLRASYAVDPETGCWVWLRGVTPKGYGKIRFQGRSWYRRGKHRECRTCNRDRTRARRRGEEYR